MASSRAHVNLDSCEPWRLSLAWTLSLVARHRGDPLWKGEGLRAGGRPSALKAPERKQLLKLVFAERGEAKVNMPH